MIPEHRLIPGPIPDSGSLTAAWLKFLALALEKGNAKAEEALFAQEWEGELAYKVVVKAIRARARELRREEQAQDPSELLRYGWTPEELVWAKVKSQATLLGTEVSKDRRFRCARTGRQKWGFVLADGSWAIYVGHPTHARHWQLEDADWETPGEAVQVADAIQADMSEPRSRKKQDLANWLATRPGWTVQQVAELDYQELRGHCATAVAAQRAQAELEEEGGLPELPELSELTGASGIRECSEQPAGVHCWVDGRCCHCGDKAPPKLVEAAQA